MANGEAVRAAELLRSAADGYAAAGAEWEAAVSRVDLAEALAAQGMPAEIPGLLAVAERPLRRAGALAELARWDDLHGRYGDRLVDRGQLAAGGRHPRAELCRRHHLDRAGQRHDVGVGVRERART